MISLPSILASWPFAVGAIVADQDGRELHRRIRDGKLLTNQRSDNLAGDAMETRRIIRARDVALMPKSSVTIGSSTQTPPEAEEAAPRKPDDYVSALIKLIPSEAIGTFVAVDGLVRGTGKLSPVAYWIVFVLLILLCAGYVARQLQKDKGQFPYLQFGLSLGAFPVWVYAVGGPFEYAGLSWYDPTFGGILAMLYSGFATLAARR